MKGRHIKVCAKNKVRNGTPYIEHTIISQTGKTDLLYISPIDQELSWHLECQDNMHGHDFNLIIWFKKGKGNHYVDFEKYSHSYICYTSFLDAIEKYYHCQHSVKKYADMLGISFCLLSKYTKEHEQRTPFEILTERILVEAKRNLKYSSLRIKEIASNLGFDDTSYFIRYFKRNVGISPIDFRNQQKNID